MNFFYKNEIINYDYLNYDNTNTIVFLHGWEGNKYSFLSTVTILKNNYNILTLTLPTNQSTISVWKMEDYVSCISNLLMTLNIQNPIIVCHSFGFRIAILLNQIIKLKAVVITGGAGPKKNDIFSTIKQNNKLIFLKNHQEMYQKFASPDYIKLSTTNKSTFKNVVNLNLINLLQFDCPILLFWGLFDHETPIWIAKKIKKINKCKLISVKNGHFAYLNHNSYFNNEIKRFLNDI